MITNLESRLIPREFRELLGPFEAGMLHRIGLRPVGVREVPIDSLHVQFRSEWPVQEPTNDPMARKPLPIRHSAAFATLREYQTYGDAILAPDRLTSTPFYRYWKNIDQVGFRYDWYDYPRVFHKRYSDERIRARLVRLIAVYESIKAHGYLGGSHESRAISVVGKPFENTRFGHRHDLDGFEIWSGHHRAASLAALGTDTARVVVLEDTRP